METKYCAAPWRGLHINFRGDVKTCCAGDPNMLGNLNDTDIDSVLQGPRLQEIRTTIQQGQLHPQYCHNCIEAERYGRSERHWHNDVNADFDITTAMVLDHRPSIIDVRWNTTCNLSCNYCGPYCSSRWAAIRGERYRSGARPYYQQVRDYIQQHQQHVREVALVGGEPLLLPENEDLLDVIPTTAIITLITNMNVDFDRNVIVQKLSTRSRVGWSMSFENVGARFEYVRSGGSWAVTDANVQRVAGWMRDAGHWGGIHAVYNLYSATNLCALREYADAVGVDILWQTLYQPAYLDPMMLGQRVQDLCGEEIARYRGRFDLTAAEQDFFGHVEQRLATTSIVDPRHGQDLRQHIQDIETKYHTHDAGRFRELWPEYEFLIKDTI